MLVLKCLKFTPTGFYENLTVKLEKLLTGLQQAADEIGIPFKTQQAGGMFGLYFTDQEDITSFDSMLACDVEAFKSFPRYVKTWC